MPIRGQSTSSRRRRSRIGSLPAALGQVLGRPTLAPLPGVAARFAFGEMADALFLSSARVEPGQLMDHGYPFRFPELRAAFAHLLGKPGDD